MSPLRKCPAAKSIISVLRDGLLQRLTQQGHEHFDLQATLDRCDDYFHSLRELTEKAEQLAVHDLLQAAEGMVAGYNALWRQPFPPGLGAGQILLSAVLERPMRDLLRGLEALVTQNEEDASTEEPLLNLDAEEEMEIFNDWLDGLPSYQRQGLKTVEGHRFGTLAVSFLLGWWFGSD